MDRNAEFEFDGIENTYKGFNLYFHYGHDHLRCSKILVFEFTSVRINSQKRQPSTY